MRRPRAAKCLPSAPPHSHAKGRPEQFRFRFSLCRLLQYKIFLCPFPICFVSVSLLVSSIFLALFLSLKIACMRQTSMDNLQLKGLNFFTSLITRCHLRQEALEDSLHNMHSDEEVNVFSLSLYIYIFQFCLCLSVSLFPSLRSLSLSFSLLASISTFVSISIFPSSQSLSSPHIPSLPLHITMTYLKSLRTHFEVLRTRRKTFTDPTGVVLGAKNTFKNNT